MNITCEKCNKRYSIADERVRGKAVKIRCKHCQNLMVVRGAEERPAAQPALEVVRSRPVARPSSDDEPTRAGVAFDPTVVWFAMLKGQQTGPFDMRALHVKVKAGEISQKTYLWHQGLGDWKRARDLPEMQTLFSSPSTAAAQPEAPPVPEPKPVPSPVTARRSTRGSLAIPAVSPVEKAPVRAPVEEPQTTPDEPAHEQVHTDPVRDLPSFQAPAPEITSGEAPANGHDPLGELFSDADLPAQSGEAEAKEGAQEIGTAAPRKKGKKDEDPFAALGEIDPSMLPPPGEATRFFIEQAGVNKRNPPWKIAAFVLGGIGLPVAALYLLSMLKIVPLEVTRVDAQGVEVKESLFSAGGVSGIRDLLTGAGKKHQPAKPPPKAVAVVPVKKVTATGPVEVVKDAPPTGPTAEEMAALYGDSQKADKGPRVRKDVEVKQTDTATGGLAEEAVAKVVAQSQPAFQQCIEQELRKNPGFRGGKIDITALVGSSGVVKSASIDRKDIDLSDLGGCLKGRAKRMQFPSFAGDEETEVHIPLILSATL